MKWIDPRYADIVAAMRQAQAQRGGDARPVRGFVVPASK